MSKVIELVHGQGQVYADGSAVFPAEYEFTLRSRDNADVSTMRGTIPVEDERLDFNGWVRPTDGTDQFAATYELSGKRMTIQIQDGREVCFTYTPVGWNVALAEKWPTDAR